MIAYIASGSGYFLRRPLWQPLISEDIFECSVPPTSSALAESEFGAEAETEIETESFLRPLCLCPCAS